MKGKNGQQLAAENVARVQEWINARDVRRDWHEYEFSKRINRRVLAEELDFAKSVCTQNQAVRSLLEGADKRWFGTRCDDRVAHEAARDRAEKQTGQVSKTNGQLTRRIAELEAEVFELRKQLSAYKKQQELVESGLAGFRL